MLELILSESHIQHLRYERVYHYKVGGTPFNLQSNNIMSMSHIVRESTINYILPHNLTTITLCESVAVIYTFVLLIFLLYFFG